MPGSLKNEERDGSAAAQTKGDPLQGPTVVPIIASEPSVQNPRGEKAAFSLLLEVMQQWASVEKGVNNKAV